MDSETTTQSSTEATTQNVEQAPGFSELFNIELLNNPFIQSSLLIIAILIVSLISFRIAKGLILPLINKITDKTKK